MATLSVRFRSGDEAEWEIHERVDLRRAEYRIANAILGGRPVVVGTASRGAATPADFGRVGINASEIASWHIDGFVDDAALLGPWAEADWDESGEPEGG